MMASKRNNKALPIAQLFKKYLPQGYAQKRAQIEQYQSFFATRAGDAVFQMVTVTNVSESELVLSLPNSALASYLRLHGGEIRAEIRELFGVELSLKITTRPPLYYAASEQFKKPFKADISVSSSEQMKSSAEYVDDEPLKNALKSLSDTLLKRRG